MKFFQKLDTSSLKTNYENFAEFLVTAVQSSLYKGFCNF